MADMTREQQVHLENIQRIKRARLNILEEQQAQMGRSTPPETVGEIRQLKKDLGLADNIKDASEEMLELLGRFAQRRSTDTLVLDIQSQLHGLKRNVQYLWYTMLGCMIFAMLVGVYVLARLQVL